jgi:hypothetical protein
MMLRIRLFCMYTLFCGRLLHFQFRAVGPCLPGAGIKDSLGYEKSGYLYAIHDISSAFGHCVGVTTHSTAIQPFKHE